MVWGKKKPTVFDAAQDRQLKALIKNQTAMIQNQNYLLKEHTRMAKDNKTYWSWIQHLSKRVKSLEARMTANEQRDAEQAQLFANLSRTASEAAASGQTEASTISE